MSLTEFAAESGAPVVEAAPALADTFMVLELGAIVPSATNPRKHFNQARLEELAQTIKAGGVLQPVLVRPLPASRLQDTFEGRKKGEPLPAYELIAGERRWRASKIAGETTIPAIVRYLSDQQARQIQEMQLVENLQRDDLHPMEEAEGYEDICRETGVSKEDLGERIGRSRGYVYARIKLLALCQQGRDAFYEGRIDSSRALVIARIPDTKLQLTALEEATAKDWNGGDRHNFKSFVRWAQQNVMLRLDAARFKITDEALVPEAGSCKACPKRTGAQPDVFADVDSADVCIDPACYHAKEQAYEAIVLAQAAAKGQRVITEKEAKKLWQWEHGTIDGYIRIDRPDPRVGGSKMLKTVLGKQMPEPILMQNPHKQGELIEVLPRDKVNSLLKDSGKITPHQARAERTVSAEEAKRNAIAKFEKAWRRRAIERVHQAMTDQMEIDPTASLLGEGLARIMARDMLGGLRGDERQHVCQLLGLGKIADGAAIQDYLNAATALQAEQAMFLLLMEQDLIHLVGYYSSDNGKPTSASRIEAVAAHYQVPLGPLKEALAAEMREASTPKKAAEPAPTPEKAQGAKKSSAPPAAQASRAKKPTKEQVQRDIAAAYQALDGATNDDQAPDGADLDEGAAPAAPAAAVPQVGDRVAVDHAGHHDHQREGVVTQVRGSGNARVLFDGDDGQALLPIGWLKVLAAALWPFPTQIGGQLDAQPAPEPGSGSGPAFKVGQLAKVKAGSKGPGGKKLKTIGRVGRIIGVGEDGRIHLRHGERSHELVVLEPDQLEHYTADPLIGSKVRILAAPGLDVRRAALTWRHGVVEALRTDGWAIRLASKDDADGQLEIFGTDELEVLA